MNTDLIYSCVFPPWDDDGRYRYFANELTAVSSTCVLGSIDLLRC